MFTPTITKKVLDKEKNIIVLTVDFSDGKQTITQEARFGTDQTKEMIEYHLKRRAKSLVSGKSEFDKIVIGPVDITSVPDDLRTAERIEADEWLQRINKLEKIKELVELGQLTGQEPAVLALREETRALFKPKFINLL